MASFPHLSSPGRIGNLELKNRMVVTAMGTNFAEEDGSMGPRLLDYHERQARGGVGLIIVGVMGVMWPHGGNKPRQTAISEDRHIEGLKAVADAVHAHGAKIAAQLHHGGMVSVQDMKEGRPVWTPSYPSPGGHSDLGDGMLFEEMAAFHDPDAPEPIIHVMTQEDINTLVGRFADAAERAQKAGFDGAEIHGGHGYILSGFLSPALNQRDDNYGGSLENRARLLLEVVTAVRERVGPDFAVWVKLDSEEFGKAEGITLTDATEVAKMVEAAGADAITVSSYHDTNRGALHSESNIPHVPGRMVSNAQAIRTQLNIPVIASGRIEVDEGEKHISAGQYDFLAMGRKLLADPDLPSKVCAGKPEQIRPCVYCYCCVSQIYVLKPTKCAVNPETGRERERALIATDVRRHIGVIGGGPGGMEAARRLSIRGHQVTLFEAGNRLGGTLQFASIAYKPNERLLDWLRLQIRLSDVSVKLNTAATPELLKRLGIDEVVVATGAKRDMPELPGNDQDFVYSGDEMRALVMAQDHPNLQAKTDGFTRFMVKAGSLTGATGIPEVVRQASKLWLPLGERIGIIGGELVGLELAEFLAERGRKVTVFESGPRAGKGLYLVRRMRLLDELQHLGVTLIKDTKNVAIEDHRIAYSNARGQERHVDLDHVIVAQGATGDESLADSLKAAGLKVHAIGDCTGVSYIEGAIEAAAEVAIAI